MGVVWGSQGSLPPSIDAVLASGLYLWNVQGTFSEMFNIPMSA